MVINTLDQAMERIAELEKENASLKEQIAYYENRKLSGRKKHNDKWQAQLEELSVMFKEGKSVAEIEKIADVSRRTIYRYKTYYDAMKSEE